MQTSGKLQRSLPPEYVVRREGNIFSLFVCLYTRGYPGYHPPVSGGRTRYPPPIDRTGYHKDRMGYLPRPGSGNSPPPRQAILQAVCLLWHAQYLPTTYTDIRLPPSSLRSNFFHFQAVLEIIRSNKWLASPFPSEVGASLPIWGWRLPSHLENLPPV